jgi:hypothetical protein
MNASKAQQKGQQRLLLVTGGVLVVIAASLLWCNKYSRTRRREHRDDLIFDEADDDDDDINNEPDEELQRVFSEASKVAKSFGGGVLDQRDQLMLYGLYKQATEGDRNDDDYKAVSFCMPRHIQYHPDLRALLFFSTNSYIYISSSSSTNSHQNSTLLRMQNTIHGGNSMGCQNDLPCKSIVKLCIILPTEVNRCTITTQVAMVTMPM